MTGLCISDNGHDQEIARPGPCHIGEANSFRAVASQLLLGRIDEFCWSAAAERLQPQPARWHDVPAGLVPGRPATGFSKKDDGKFQPFGLVDGPSCGRPLVPSSTIGASPASPRSASELHAFDECPKRSCGRFEAPHSSTRLRPLPIPQNEIAKVENSRIGGYETLNPLLGEKGVSLQPKSLRLDVLQSDLPGSHRQA